MKKSIEQQKNRISKLVEDLFFVESVGNDNEKILLSLRYKYTPEKSIKFLNDRLKLAGYDFHINSFENGINLLVDGEPSVKIPRINIILFIITFCSVYFVPVFFNQYFIFDFEPLVNKIGWAGKLDFTTWEILKLNFMAVPDIIENTVSALGRGVGLEFTLAMISILFVHEMGHYIASRRRDIVTSWPYFIPAPNIIGTFGAVIKSKSPFWNRRDLIEVGASGPIAGWIVAVLWLIYGLSQSSYLPAEQLVGFGGFSLEGESILMRIATLSIIGEAPPGYFYSLSEAAFAGWVGLLVTAINMLPIGQLDGGHIVYGLMGKKQKVFGIIAMAVLIILGFTSQMWWLFALFGILFGVKHPSTLNDNIRPSRFSIVMGVAAILILIVSFTPIPFRS